MEKITSYLIAVGLIGFGAWILAFGIAIGISSRADRASSMYDELNNGSS